MANVQRETLSELKVEDVFARRLALEEIDEARQSRLYDCFNRARQALDEEKNA